jgi:nicotinate-nucleotide adenylyltransferase
MEFTSMYRITDDVKLMYPRVKTGILGGTFNPVHNGHIDMALNIRREFDLKTVALMPCGSPPHKPDRTELAPAAMRRHMAALATCEAPELSVSDMEIKRGGPTYTVDTMRELTGQYKDTEFYFIIGSDSLFQLETWKDFSELSRLTRFVCVRRQEHDPLAVAAEAKHLEEAYGAAVFISQYSGLYVSSSYIRKRVAGGRGISDFVPALVEEYINASGLYK